MRVKADSIVLALILAAVLCGCGAAYQASTEIRAHRMEDSLQPGESMTAVRLKWGIPDLTIHQSDNKELWSYASRPNSNDIAATLFYTGAKEGDTGKFLDLHFVDGRLVSWNETQHTMPTKQRASFGFTVGNTPQSGSTHF